MISNGQVTPSYMPHLNLHSIHPSSFVVPNTRSICEHVKTICKTIYRNITYKYYRLLHLKYNICRFITIFFSAYYIHFLFFFVNESLIIYSLQIVYDHFIKFKILKIHNSRHFIQCLEYFL